MENNNITGAEIEHNPFYIGRAEALAGLRWRRLSPKSKINKKHSNNNQLIEKDKWEKQDNAQECTNRKINKAD